MAELAVSSEAMTKRPPCSRAPHISHTDTSNEYEWNIDHTCPGDNSDVRAGLVNSCVTFWWVTETPLGVPVVPEV